MPASPIEEFRRSLDRLDRIRAKMENLHSEGRISLTELHSVYEALFLRMVISFEVFLEKLFFSIMKGTATFPKKRVSLRMTVTSPQALKEILHQNKSYIQWIPYGNTEDRAKLYLNGGRPFTEITDGDRSTIKTITVIRNAVAHGSEHATAEFKRTVIGGRLLLPSEKRPAGFLRSRANPAQRRFEIYAIQLSQIACSLC